MSAFGPLWEESVVASASAAPLVRAAAVAGGRAVRATLPLYHHAYAERARSLLATAHAHKQPTTFEEFVERVRDPVPAAALNVQYNAGKQRGLSVSVWS